MSVSTNQASNSALTILNTKIPHYQEQPGESYMNPRQKAHLKQILETERSYWADIQKRIISELLQKKTGRVPSDSADIANREVELRSAVRGREHRLIKKIDDALNRLGTEGSHYGFCNACNAQIGIQRLEVRPTANLCFDCKTLDEIREKQNGSG
jgi:DnaK suppressor protein